MTLSRRALLAVAATAPVAAVLPAAPLAGQSFVFVERGAASVRVPTCAQLDQVIAAMVAAAAVAYQLPVHILEGRAEP